MLELSRRGVMALAAGATLAATGRVLANDRLYMPAEWHPHSGCFMAFSAALAQYGDELTEEVRTEQATVARAIGQFEPVIMLVNPEDMSDAERLVGDAAQLIEVRHYDIWARDTLPTFVLAENQQAESAGPASEPVAEGEEAATDAVEEASEQIRGVSWNFNIWGDKFPGDPGYDDDRGVAERLGAELGIEIIKAGIVAEGGAIETDGEGTLLTTESCLLNPNRNPGMSKEAITAELVALTGVDKVLWLPGSEEDFITDGHIDGIARFTSPGVVIAEITDDPQDAEFDALEENARALEAATDARGRSLQVARLLRPRWEHMLDHGEYFAASYVNYYLANGGIVMPKFGDQERDAAARDLIARLHPGYKIMQLTVDAICEGGGGIHCNTQQMPALR